MSPNLVAISGIGEAVQGAAPLVRRMGGPKALVGRIVGLGEAEIRAGVPGWAWLGVGALAAGMLVYVNRHRLERMLGDDEE